MSAAAPRFIGSLGQEVPDFTGDSTMGQIKFHEWLGGSWAILFSHPLDYTPVCTTELSRVQQLAPEFAARGVKCIALSCDDVESHKGWLADIQAYGGVEINYPILADKSRDLAVLFGMLDPDLKDADGLPVPVRKVFVIGPDRKVKLTITYPPPTGRNFDEILRVVDGLQLTAKHSCATPCDWKSGDKVVILPAVSDADAAIKFPKGFEKKALPSGKGYLRFTPDPRS